MKEQARVTIIGGGAIGSAIRHLLQEKKIHARIWDVDASKMPKVQTLQQAMNDADVVFLCLPSWAMRAALKNVAPSLSKKTIIVSLAKGIEPRTHLTMDRLIGDVLPGQPFALLAGPMLAKELMAGERGGAVVATKNGRAAKIVKSLFEGTSLQLRPSTDVRGVALASVLKNVYSIGLGIATGLGAGADRHGMLVVDALDEMQRIIKKLGGRPRTALGLAGLGDLTATGFSPNSTNRTFGVAVAKNRRRPPQSEGAHALPSLLALLKGSSKSYRFLHTIELVLMKRRAAKTYFKYL